MGPSTIVADGVTEDLHLCTEFPTWWGLALTPRAPSGNQALSAVGFDGQVPKLEQALSNHIGHCNCSERTMRGCEQIVDIGHGRQHPDIWYAISIPNQAGMAILDGLLHRDTCASACSAAASQAPRSSRTDLARRTPERHKHAHKELHPDDGCAPGCRKPSSRQPTDDKMQRYLVVVRPYVLLC